MQANRNTLDHIRHLAKLADVSASELLAMAREAEHLELMPSLEHLSREGAARLVADLAKLRSDKRWIQDMETILSRPPIARC